MFNFQVDTFLDPITHNRRQTIDRNKSKYFLHCIKSNYEFLIFLIKFYKTITNLL